MTMSAQSCAPNGRTRTRIHLEVRSCWRQIGVLRDWATPDGDTLLWNFRERSVTPPS
jgi:hypothetical protein